jgi:ubiquinone/menaquinone biosynthesis C-methylase UbiE
MPDQLLAKQLRKIAKVFDVETLVAQEIDAQTVVDYYENSNYGYKVFHSTAGSIHLALNYDGVFRKEGYYEQARIVSQHISVQNARQVLELASGKGFNARFLAGQHPGVQFCGIDLTPSHVREARASTEGIPNVAFEIGNFQNLHFAASSFDLIYEVESICHASDMQTALAESFRVLRPSGRFIVIDGFRKPGFDGLSSDLQVAARLVEVSLAVERMWIIDDWLQVARTTGFRVTNVDDLSYAIMPNLMRYQKLARGYFRYPRVSRFLLATLPEHLVKNAIAGLLMPTTVQAGAQGYFVIVLEKD